VFFKKYTDSLKHPLGHDVSGYVTHLHKLAFINGFRLIIFVFETHSVCVCVCVCVWVDEGGVDNLLHEGKVTEEN